MKTVVFNLPEGQQGITHTMGSHDTVYRIISIPRVLVIKENIKGLTQTKAAY